MILRKSMLTAILLCAAGFLFGFSLPRANVYPRLFSPNGDGINDVVYFDVVNPSLATVEGRVYDASGSEVGDLKPVPLAAVPPLTADALMWDGKDRNGNTVPAGVYIYRISGGGQKISGTVVVAK
jgi:hypothetical protein